MADELLNRTCFFGHFPSIKGSHFILRTRKLVKINYNVFYSCALDILPELTIEHKIRDIFLLLQVKKNHGDCCTISQFMIEETEASRNDMTVLVEVSKSSSMSPSPLVCYFRDFFSSLWPSFPLE